MTRDVSLPVDGGYDVDTLCALARRAEALGYDRVWLPQTWGRDAVTVLAAIAERTEAIGLGASVLPVYSRSPALIGQTAATLQELSDGRFRLGLGPSGPIVVENWHGVAFERPLKRTRETVEIVRAIVRGETVHYHGDCFELTGFRLRADPPDPPPMVDAAGMGPKAVELAGRFADGWHGFMLTLDGLRDRLQDFNRGVELAARDRSAGRVTVSVPCCALADGDRARRLTRQSVAFYLGGMGSFYRDSLARQGYDELAHEVAAKWSSGKREVAVATVSDDLLDELAAAGSSAHARDQLGRFEAIEGVEAVSVSFPRGADLDVVTATMETLAP